MLQFIFSTALDGKIKAWLYDNLGSRVDYDAPGRWCTTMAYSADGTRLIYFNHCVGVNHPTMLFVGVSLTVPIKFLYGGVKMQALFMWDQ